MTISYSSNRLRDVLTTLIQERNISESELARSINMPRATINRITLGKIVDPKSSTLNLIANYFNITIDQLLGREKITNSDKLNTLNKVQVPIITFDQLTDIYKKSHIIKHGDIPDQELITFKYKQDSLKTLLFGIKIKGEAMWPYFDDNSTIIIDTSAKPQNRSFVLAYIADTDEIIIRQLLIDAKSRVLTPINTAFRSITMSTQDLILGVVIHVEKNFQY